MMLPSLLEGFPEPAFVLDSSGQILGANRAAERLTGCGPDNLLRRNVRDLLTAESYAHLEADFQGAVGSFIKDVEFVHAAGTRMTVELRGTRDETGQVQFVTREIAARKRTDEQLRPNEIRFRFMARNLSEMVVAYDMNRRLTFVNPAVQTLTGYSAEELEQAQFINWVHPEDRGRMLGYWDRLFEGRSFQEEEYRLVSRDGRIKWVAASWGPILDDQGRQVGVQGREREVTERHMAEETLRQSEQRHRLNEERYRTLFEDSPFPLWEEDFSELK